MASSSSKQIIGSPTSPCKHLRMSSGRVARQAEAFVQFISKIDVIGSVVNMGRVKTTHTGTQFLNFQLQNQRGITVNVTAWGALCDDILSRVPATPELYIILLTSMTLKEQEGNTSLSTTSTTCIKDSDENEEIACFRRSMAGLADRLVPEENNDAPLLHLLLSGRRLFGLNKQQSLTMACTVRVTGIRAHNGWHYFSCGVQNCGKPLVPVENSFWCEACDSICDLTVPRYRLELDVKDKTATLVVIVWDEIAESMVKKSVTSLLQANEDAEKDEIPAEVLELINTTHVLELKTHTYYDYDQYESFTASKVITTAAAEDV